MSDVFFFGIDNVIPRSLAVGLAGSFIMLAAIATLVVGRILMASSDPAAAAHHIKMCQTAGLLAIAIGSVCIVTAGARSLLNPEPTLRQVALGLAGAFLFMTGLMANLANRVVVHTCSIGEGKGASAGSKRRTSLKSVSACA